MKLIPSATVYKKYRRYTSYKAKVIIVDGSSITSKVFDEPFSTKEAAIDFAQRTIKENKVLS